jgi:hypothetical protein
MYETISGRGVSQRDEPVDSWDKHVRPNGDKLLYPKMNRAW